VVLWWAPTTNTAEAGLHRLLFGRSPGDQTIPDLAPLPSDREAAAVLDDLAARGGAVIEPSLPAAATAAPPSAANPGALSVRIFDRDLDTAWRRLSYSSLAAAGERTVDPGVTSEPETAERDDEAVPVVPTGHTDDGALRALVSPMAELPAGTSFGTLVHAVLETVDPQADDLTAEVRTRCAEQLARRPAAVTPDALADALLPALRTPLGLVGDGLTLRDLGTHDRLTELAFELPLAGGDRVRPGADATLGDLAPILSRHLRAGDPLASYAERLTAPEIAWQPLRGYLTGSLDAVLRLPGPRYVVADYKTNWLGEEDEPLTVWHYRPAALAEVMTRSHYPLQAILYAVALHRFLRWRQPGYDPAAHLGGVLYLFLRGMNGPDTPEVDGEVCGVFGWRPPAAMVEELSTLLDRGSPALAGERARS
jgi:exodeoxyribonuclease V beta subunit